MNLEKRFKEILYCLGERDWDILTTEAWDKYINQDTPFNEKQMEDIKYFVDLLLEDLKKFRFEISWRVNHNYGIGEGKVHCISHNEEGVLELFWSGRNKEAFDIVGIIKHEV